jgi:hypothetical protein
MHELLNIRTGKTIAIPSDIDELSPAQYLFYIDLAFQYFNGSIKDVSEVKHRLFVYLTDLKVSSKMNFYMPETQEAIWSAVAAQVDLMDSFFDIEVTETGRSYRMHTESVRQLLPRWKQFSTYSDIFEQMKWGEFRKCCDLFKMIKVETDRDNDAQADELVRELFLTLYKSKKKLNPKQKIPESVLFHALNYFSYIFHLVTTTPIEINGEEIDFSQLWGDDDENNTSEPNKLGWNSIHFELSEKGVFGNAEQADKEKFMNVFLWMYKQRMDALQLEKRINKSNAND